MSAGPARVALHLVPGEPGGGAALRRTLAIAEELVLRGQAVLFVADTAEAPAVRAQLEARSLAHACPPPTVAGWLELFDREGVASLVTDARTLPGALHEQVRGSGRPTLAVLDGEPDLPYADVLVDPRVAVDPSGAKGFGPTRLYGPEYALVRNDVLANRPISAPGHAPVEVPRVVVLCDDDAAVACALVRVLAASGRPFEATVVTGSTEVRGVVGGERLAPRQRLNVAAPDWRLVDRLSRAHVVLSPVGPETPDLLCLGAAVGLVWAGDEDVEGYRWLMVRRAVVGLGSASGLADDPEPGAEKVTRLLSDPRERERLAEVGWGLVDGYGRARVVDALLALGGS